MGVIFENLVDSAISATNSDTLIVKMGNMLLTQGFVKESYTKAVQEREKIFPTGLKLKKISVAMPHTDSIHVKNQVFVSES